MKKLFVTIAGVKCTLDFKGRLILELPSGMNGVELIKWRLKYREQAIIALK